MTATALRVHVCGCGGAAEGAGPETLQSLHRVCHAALSDAGHVDAAAGVLVYTYSALADALK